MNLYDLDDAALKAAETKFSGAWKAARAQFMSKHQARIDLNNVKDSGPVRKAKPEAEPEIETDAIGADFDEDWGDDFDD